MTRETSTHPLAQCAPSAGFPVTICVVAYGPHAALSQRFLVSLYRNTDPALFQLRAGLNEVEPATERLFLAYAERYGNVQLFVEPSNIYKAPLMRKLFHEPPVASSWTIWCDDDAYFTRSDWLVRLGWKMESEPQVAMWGKPYTLSIRESYVAEWIAAAAWYRHLPLIQNLSEKAERSWQFSFITGGFWAIRTHVLRWLDWPDRRLIQALDDVLLGEALRQNALAQGSFKYGVEIHDAPRRNPAALAVQKLAPAHFLAKGE